MLILQTEGGSGGAKMAFVLIRQLSSALSTHSGIANWPVETDSNCPAAKSPPNQGQANQMGKIPERGGNWPTWPSPSRWQPWRAETSTGPPYCGG